MSIQVNPAFMIDNHPTQQDLGDETLVPLEQIVRDAYSAASVKTEQDKIAIDKIMSDPGALSNPAILADLQNRLGDYTIYVSFISTLAKKATTTIETLIKAQ